jgi:hypothetical protein
LADVCEKRVLGTSGQLYRREKEARVAAAE